MDMDCLKPKSREASVQCEQMKRPKGLDTSTSTDDYEDYLQSQHRESLPHKPLEDSELFEPVTLVMCDIQPDGDMGCCLDLVSLTESDTTNQLEPGQPTSSSTPVKDTNRLALSIDSGIHASDGEADSFNELMSLHDPISSSSSLVILDPETVLQELCKDINSLFQARNNSSSADYRMPDIQGIVEEASRNQCLATSLYWGRILFEMELLRSQRCKNPLKGSGLV